MSDTFELLGTDGDETRLLVHRGCGYAVPIPGRARAVPTPDGVPKYDVLLTLADAPVEIGFRLDPLPTSADPKATTTALALTYATARARETPRIIAGYDRNLAPGASAAAFATYALPGEGEQRAMEYLLLTTKRTEAAAWTVYLTMRFRTGEIATMLWANVRTAIVANQRWNDAAPPSSVWPASAYAAASAALQLTERARQEARLKAAELGGMSEAHVDKLVDMLIMFTNRNDEAPATEMHPYIRDQLAGQVRMAAPPEITTVLLRDVEGVKTMHDFRAWSWECMWAIGNRARFGN